MARKSGGLGFRFCLQEVRQAQEDVHAEQTLSDLRLEIMSVQEDVRRESESEASSAHSPLDYLSQTSANRYQVRKANQSPESVLFRGQFSDLPRRLKNTFYEKA